MTDATTTLTRQNDPSLCPGWCTQRHVGCSPDDGGFHHDGEPCSVPVQGSPEGTEQLFVAAAQFVPDGGHDEPPHVVLQDEARTVALLTPREAVSLALALLSAAESVLDA